MSQTKVAILGRPNVGKSTLFNILTRSRQAVVKDQPGVTRDVLIREADWWGKQFEVLDTGGLTEAKDSFSPLIRAQVEAIIDDMDLLVVVMDGRSGLTYEDRAVFRLAKQSNKPYLLVVNKVDRMAEAELFLSEFYEFGEDLVATSFEQRDGVDQVVQWIVDRVKVEKSEEISAPRLAIVGKPNVGKSSLFNHLLGQNRVLVSDVAGTTVDSVEDLFSWKDKKFKIVDTAGLRRSGRRKNMGDGVEILSAFKSHKAIDHADVVLLLVDATEGVTDQDAKLVDYILSQHKAVILVANKIDLAEKNRPAARQWFRNELSRQFHFFPDVRLVFTSAATGAGVERLLKEVQEVYEKLHMRISTSKLNNFFYEVIRQAPAPVYGTHNVKFYYLTQTQQQPPSFIAFANHPQGVTASYRRFLTKRIQGQWGLEGIPVRMFIMKSGGAPL